MVTIALKATAKLPDELVQHGGHPLYRFKLFFSGTPWLPVEFYNDNLLAMLVDKLAAFKEPIQVSIIDHQFNIFCCFPPHQAKWREPESIIF
ncbi:hypothetical protein Zmor_012116 [Zophobas morio]|jgi:hypothetical protein|uniref:Uncharacterized protein n=1 Tax=Zophobas morio TaxID=2755281 RepID=A0AA38HP72_9CUCU|nr:hypothetical protein Zmor_012116 [Zophobas morio]